MGTEHIWDVISDLQRDEFVLELNRPCECGCDFRDGVKGVGYIFASAGRGRGCTIWIEDEEVYRELEETFKIKENINE